MTAADLIPILLAVLAIVLVFVIWPPLLRLVLQFLRNVALGLALLWVLGRLLGAPWQVGINPLTAGVCGVLGVPGWILLVVLKGFVL